MALSKSIFLVLVTLIMLSFAVPVVADTIDVGSVDQVTSDQFVGKVENMAAALYKVALKIIIPFTIIIFITGGIAAVFFKEARRIIVWALVGLVLVFWAPMLVQLTANWIKM